MNYAGLLASILCSGSSCAPRGQEIKELLHVRLTVCDPIWYWPKVRPLKTILGYWSSELAWYMSCDRRVDFIEKQASLWGQICNHDRTANSNYGYLVFSQRTPHPSDAGATMSGFDWAVHSLLKDPFTRQAIITYNNGGYNYKENNDYICTQHQAFFIRDNKLHCFIALRSSDAIWGLPYNMPWWSFIAQQIRLAVIHQYPLLEIAPIEVDIYSAHIYARHFSLVRRMLLSKARTKNFNCKDRIAHGFTPKHYLDRFKNYIDII